MSIHGRLLGAIALAATTGIAGPASATNTCTGTGTATLGAGISYFPTISANVSFTFTFNCIEGGSFSGDGLLSSASCGRSSGTGVIGPISKDFSFETAGSMLLAFAVDGDVVMSLGNATAIPDTSRIPFGNNCSSGTAEVFQLSGEATCVDTNYGHECTALRDYT